MIRNERCDVVDGSDLRDGLLAPEYDALGDVFQGTYSKIRVPFDGDSGSLLVIPANGKPPFEA